MPITSINRDNYVGGPSIVRLTTSDDLATSSSSGYLTTQLLNVAALNNGAFDWEVGDMVALFASDGDGIFQFSGNDFSTLIPLSSSELPANVVLNNQINNMGSAPAAIFFTQSNGTEATGNVSVNGQCGVITSSSQTLASGGTYVMTVANPYCLSATVPCVSLTLLNGTNTAGDRIYLKVLPLSVGNFQVQILNGNSGALNGTIQFSYWIAH